MDKFCVYLTIYYGNKLPPFYIGSGTTHKLMNKDRPYRGSVLSLRYKEIWKAELKVNPHLFNTRIIKCFGTRNEAFDYEEFLHRKLDVVKNVLYVNRSIANTRPNNIGIPRTDKTKLKISKYQKGKPKSEEHKQKIGNSNRGKIRSDEVKRTLTLRHLGNTYKRGTTQTEETKLKISASKKGKPSSKKGTSTNRKGMKLRINPETGKREYYSIPPLNVT